LDNTDIIGKLNKDMAEKSITSTLNKRIEWVRNELDRPLTPDVSNNFQWLLNHLISIRDSEVIPIYNNLERVEEDCGEEQECVEYECNTNRPALYDSLARFNDDNAHNSAVAMLIECYSNGLGDNKSAEHVLYINHLLAGLRR
jgi:hypothetical protein